MSRSLRTSQPPESQPNYLFFSDVHLGADLVQHARPWTVGRLRRVLQLDRELSSMLDHYREQAEPGRPWKLVIAGDLVDFVGMSIAPTTGQELETPLTAEEQSHGLGSARDHAFYKMRACASRHDLVFRKLADFVLAGHSLVLIRGNHDVDFYWETARSAFVQALVDRAGEAITESTTRQAFEARVEFRQWFYYVEDLLYVEHGHQYDETCAHTHWLAPMSPRDPRRIAYSFSDILMRYIVRPTPGLSTEGHDDKNLLDYLKLAFGFGIGGALRLGYRYGHAIYAMFAEWRDHVSERAREVRAEHERHMHEIGERFRVSSERLRALYALSATPVNTRPFRIMSTLFVDLAATAALSTIVLLGLFVSGLVPLKILGPIAALVLAGLVFWHKSARVFDPPSALKRGAAHIAKLFPTRFVIMGHTHAPTMEKIDNGATYVNLGGWAVDDLDVAEPKSDADADAAPHQAPCTHLVIRHVDGRPRAELRRWNSRTGIKLLHSDDSGATADGDSGVRPRPENPEERVA